MTEAPTHHYTSFRHILYESHQFCATTDHHKSYATFEEREGKHCRYKLTTKGTGDIQYIKIEKESDRKGYWDYSKFNEKERTILQQMGFLIDKDQAVKPMH